MLEAVKKLAVEVTQKAGNRALETAIRCVASNPKLLRKSMKGLVDKVLGDNYPAEAEDDSVAHAERILPKIREGLNETNDKVGYVLREVFKDKELEKAVTARIQLDTMRGMVAQKILAEIGEDPNKIGILAIGDIKVPEFAEGAIDEILLKAALYNFAYSAYGVVGGGRGNSYDISALGRSDAREAAVEYLDKSYGFSNNPYLLDVLKKNSMFTNGGMDAIAKLVVEMTQKQDKEGENIGKTRRFIYPDSTFVMGEEIMKWTNTDPDTEFYKLPTERKNLLHLTPELAEKYYEEHGKEGVNDTWYIIPVGNPTGTTYSYGQLDLTCRKIIECNPNAAIVLDCAYLRTLDPNHSKDLMLRIMNNPGLLQRIIFMDSLSKSHGFCNSRAGIIFTFNDEWASRMKTLNTVIGMGSPQYTSALWRAVADGSPETEETIKKWHWFWAAEKLGLYQYLLESCSFDDLFDSDQEHMEGQMGIPMGIYLDVKLKDGVDSQQVALKTGCLGVEHKLGDDTYIRFSVGTITEPTYVKYLPDRDMTADPRQICSSYMAAN